VEAVCILVTKETMELDGLHLLHLWTGVAHSSRAEAAQHPDAAGGKERRAPWGLLARAAAGAAIGVQRRWPRGSEMSCRRGSQPAGREPAGAPCVPDPGMGNSGLRRGHHRSSAAAESRERC